MSAAPPVATVGEAAVMAQREAVKRYGTATSVMEEPGRIVARTMAGPFASSHVSSLSNTCATSDAGAAFTIVIVAPAVTPSTVGVGKKRRAPVAASVQASTRFFCTSSSDLSSEPTVQYRKEELWYVKAAVSDAAARGSWKRRGKGRG